MGKVFISYRHESDTHRDRVRVLAERLRTAGLEVIFDGFEEANHHGMAPAQGWPLWSIQQANCDHVIIIASSGWFRIFNRHESAPSGGRGAAAEAECIFTRMYKDGGNTFAVITCFDHAADFADLPPYLEKCARLDATRDAHVEKIVNWVKGVASVPTPEMIAPAIAWPATVSFPTAALADRHEPCAFFRAMLTGATTESVACFIAESGAGKSKLLEVFQQTGATALAAAGRIAHVRNLQEFNIDSLIDKLCTIFGGYPRFPRYEHAVLEGRAEATQRVAFLNDLRLRADPTLIILDTWDKGIEELRDWTTGHLVPAVVHAPAVKLILAGQPQPLKPFPVETPHQVRQFKLGHITVQEWEQYIDERYPADAVTLKPTIRLLLTKAPTPAHGVKIIANILESYEQLGGRAA